MEREEPVFGVKGPSILNLLMPKYMESTIIDPMHCVYQGVMNKLINLWFNVEHNSHPSSLLTFSNIIDKRMKNITPPLFATRMPRKISEYSYWKASELKTFLLVYSLPVLDGIMRERYFEHYKLLVHGITLLNLESIDNATIEIARRILSEFVSRFENLYGRKYMTCNIHLLLHLPDEVKKVGPLWVLTCFEYENFNGILKSYVHGSNRPQLQICSAITTFLCLSEMKDKLIKKDSSIYNFCKKIEKSGTHRRKLKKVGEQTFICGVSIKHKNLPDYVIDICNANDLRIDVNKCHFFNRLLKSGVYYETEQYALNKKSNSSCIQYVHDNVVHIGFIRSFFRICQCLCVFSCEECVDECENYAIISECTTEKAYTCTVTQSYIRTIRSSFRTENLHLIKVNDVLNICYKISVDKNLFIVELTNNNESEK